MSIINRKAKFNYRLLEKIEAGVSLIGGEVKAIRDNRGDISNAHAKIIEGEVFLINTNIPVANPTKDYNPTRSRRLLLHKKEIISIASKIKAKKLTLVPVKVYNRKGKIKIELALAKSKRKFEKKESLKKQDIKRELEQELKNKTR